MKIEPTVLERFCDYEVYLQQSTPKEAIDKMSRADTNSQTLLTFFKTAVISVKTKQSPDLIKMTHLAFERLLEKYVESTLSQTVSDGFLRCSSFYQFPSEKGSLVHKKPVNESSALKK